MRLIDADKLLEHYDNAMGPLPTPIQKQTGNFLRRVITSEPAVEASVNPVNVLESILHSLKAKHMAEDMWEPVSPEERKKYRERYDAILKAVNVLEALQSENGGNNND